MTPPNVAIVEWVRRAFDFRGRSSRSDYWWTRGLVFIVNLTLLMVFVSALGPEGAEAIQDWTDQVLAGDAEARATLPLDWDALSEGGRFSLVFLIVFALLTFIPDLSLSWRRFHDMNLPGWIHLIFVFLGAYLPILTLAELIWFVRGGTPGPNRFGADPVERWR